MTNQNANGYGSLKYSIPELEKRLEKLNSELGGMDAGLRELMEAEKPEQGIFYAKDIHSLRQEKLQKRLEAEYCRARIRLLENEGSSVLQ